MVAASFSFSDAAGKYATVVKLTRSLMILPVTLFLAFYHARQNRSESTFSFVKIFPWFVLGFLAAAVLATTGVVPASAAYTLAQLGKFFITMAMAAIGLNTSIQAFIKAGPKALLLGAGTWAAVMISSLAIQLVSGLL